MDLQKSVEMSAIIYFLYAGETLGCKSSFISLLHPFCLPLDALELTEEFSHTPNHFETTQCALLHPCHFIWFLNNVLA